MPKIEIGEGWVISDLQNASEDAAWEYLLLKRSKKHIRWIISHPGTADLRECTSFEECMEEWFEGFNIPYKIENNVQEPFEQAHKRVSDYFAKKK